MLNMLKLNKRGAMFEFENGESQLHALVHGELNCYRTKVCSNYKILNLCGFQDIQTQ
jgi:hypothetical protein